MGTKSRKSVHLSARLPEELAAELRRHASRTGTTVSAALIGLIEESLRMARHPGIDFRHVPGGRAAFVTGTGLAVWELYRIWIDHERDAKKVLRNYPHLKPAQVTAAVRYAEAHPLQISEQARRAQPEKPLKEFPFLKPFRV